MIVKPMIRSNMCITAHPTGSRVAVQRQIEYVRARGRYVGPKSALVIGASGGYGLASRVCAAFGAGAATIGVSYETPAKGSRSASAGWYLDGAFSEAADAAGLANRSFIADAFSHETKQRVIETIREMTGTVDLVVYSLASAVRVDPDTGEMYKSSLKPTERRYESVTLDTKTGELKPAAIDPATDDEIAHTVKVMGGEDWKLWIDALSAAGVLAPGARTVAYSYIGPHITYPLYRDGTIGRAKEHLEATAGVLDRGLRASGGRAWVAINKAIVTRASAVIPAVPLYLAILYRTMKAKGIHEGTIEQMYRLFAQRLQSDEPETDPEGRVRMDDWEMRPDVQSEVEAAWHAVIDGSVEVRSVGDVDGFMTDFLQLHGFGFDDVDYQADVDV